MKQTHAIINEDMIGETHVWTAGSGDSLLVVHGGPGLDHRYLVDWLLPLTNYGRLVFYDQTNDTVVSSGDTAPRRQTHQLLGLIECLSREGRLHVLSHSWGAYLVYSVLASGLQIPLASMMLVSPVGLTRARFDASGERLVRRIPEDTLTRVTELQEQRRDLDMMRVLLPYYLARQNRKLNIPIQFYDNSKNERVLGELDNYNFTSIGSLLPTRTLFVYGDEDIENPEGTKEFQHNAAVVTLQGAGHFCFAERPVQFQSLAAQHFAAG